MKQESFFKKTKPYFGGALLRGKRKTARPLSRRKVLHLVLKASSPVLFKNKSLVNQLAPKYSRKHGVKIYSSSVQRDHFHISLRIHDRQAYTRFIRALAGQLARKLSKGLWLLRPFSRISEWGRAFQELKNYISQNEKEVLGLLPCKKRTQRYKIE